MNELKLRQECKTLQRMLDAERNKDKSAVAYRKLERERNMWKMRYEGRLEKWKELKHNLEDMKESRQRVIAETNKHLRRVDSALITILKAALTEVSHLEVARLLDVDAIEAAAIAHGLIKDPYEDNDDDEDTSS